MVTEMKDIPRYEGLYAVTEDGRVWSYPKNWEGGNDKEIKCYHSGKWLQPRIGKKQKSYYSVHFSNNGVQKSFYIHILVAKAYVPNPYSLPTVNHKDGSRLNNHYLNLEWCTQAENLEHARRTGLNKNYGETHYKKILNWEKVREIRRKYVPYICTVTQLAKEFGVSRGTIQDVLENQIWKEGEIHVQRTSNH